MTWVMNNREMRDVEGVKARLLLEFERLEAQGGMMHVPPADKTKIRELLRPWHEKDAEGRRL
jgi:hypothetical protein